MNKAVRSPTLFLIGMLASQVASNAQDQGGSWPQWRGPDRDGISKEELATTQGKAEALWSMEVGLGYSGSSIRDGRLYTMGFDEDAGLDLVWCIDAKTGEEIWVHSYGAKIWNEYHGGGTLTTPTIVGDSLVVLNREGQLFSLSLKSGELNWQRELMKEMELTLPQWGFSASPLSIDGQLIVNVGSVLSVDPASGKTLWKTKDYKEAYSTPTSFTQDGRKALAVFNGTGLAILEQGNGNELLFYPWKTGYQVNAASPIVIDDKVFISSGYGHGSALLQIKQGALEPIWESKKMQNHMNGCILIGGNLYGFDDKQLTCMGLDGKVLWSERGMGEGCLSAAREKLIVLTEKGKLLIADASPEGFVADTEIEVVPGGVCWTQPTFVDGLIYCRNSMEALVCRDYRVER